MTCLEKQGTIAVIFQYVSSLLLSSSSLEHHNIPTHNINSAVQNMEKLHSGSNHDIQNTFKKELTIATDRIKLLQSHNTAIFTVPVSNILGEMNRFTPFKGNNHTLKQYEA
jgi:hypothetical protein